MNRQLSKPIKEHLHCLLIRLFSEESQNRLIEQMDVIVRLRQKERRHDVADGEQGFPAVFIFRQLEIRVAESIVRKIGFVFNQLRYTHRRRPPFVAIIQHDWKNRGQLFRRPMTQPIIHVEAEDVEQHS